MSDRRAQLPSVTELLDHPTIALAIDTHGRERVLRAARGILEEERDRSSLDVGVATLDDIANRTTDALLRTRPLQGVINATGVVLHTNLGRAVLCQSAVEAVTMAAGTVDLEYDLTSGRRDRRGGHVATQLASLCAAEAAHVVNNGAGALMLAMAALVHGREVVVSRGELVEIGGSFRLPDILAASGVRLREVGTTNRTRLEDIAEAIDANTGAVLRVHPSNFRIQGFTEQPDLRETARLTRVNGIPLIHDIGSGLLAPSRLPQLADEPDASSVLGHGVNLAVFSGDKLLGGPQVGMIAGDGDLVERCRVHPLARALRVDKLRIAALEATLAEYARGRAEQLPTWKLMCAPAGDLRVRAESLAEALGGVPVCTQAVIGGGSAPGQAIVSWGVQLAGDPEDISAALRSGRPAVVPRMIDGHVVVDLRCVPAELDAILAAAARLACAT